MNPDQAKRTVILVAVMRYEFDTEISSPHEGVLHEESLYFPRVTGLIITKLSPSVYLDRIPVRDTEPEASEHGAKKFKVCENDSVDLDVFAQLDYKELVFCGAFIEHVIVLVFDQYGR